MKPELPSSIPTPEKRIDRNNETFTSIENIEPKSSENIERRSEAAASTVEQPGGATLFAPVANSQTAIKLGDNKTSNNPVVAADEDLIEKEWVDRAKKIIKDTKNDPFKQEKEINILRNDYINKRYRGGGHNAA